MIVLGICLIFERDFRHLCTLFHSWDPNSLLKIIVKSPSFESFISSFHSLLDLSIMVMVSCLILRWLIPNLLREILVEIRRVVRERLNERNGGNVEITYNGAESESKKGYHMERGTSLFSSLLG